MLKVAFQTKWVNYLTNGVRSSEYPSEKNKIYLYFMLATKQIPI